MDHKELDVWKKAIKLVEKIYKKTESFPKTEFYGLSGQMRRAAVSIPSNIAEGCGRNSNKELIQFLYISLGSLSELETQIIISEKLYYLNQLDAKYLIEELINIKKMILGLIKYLKGQNNVG